MSNTLSETTPTATEYVVTDPEQLTRQAIAAYRVYADWQAYIKSGEEWEKGVTDPMTFIGRMINEVGDIGASLTKVGEAR